MRVLAVDLGTSNTVAALGLDGGAPRLVTVDGSPLMPSSVFLTDEGSLAVGRDADRQARTDPSRYEPNPKRRIDDGFILLGRSALPVSTVIAEVLRRVGTEVSRQLGGEPDQVRLTHPARWGQRRRDTLLAAAGQAGFGRSVVLIPEPVAAATHFATAAGGGAGPAVGGLPAGQALGVYDLGGGTFDIAVVRRRGNDYEMLAEAGLPDLGGLDFDHAILEHIGAVLERTGARHVREVGGDAWQRLRQPVDAASRRQARALATDVRDAKEALSRYPHVDIALPPPFPDVHLTRAELEDLIRADLSRSVELMARTIADAGLTPSRLAGVYLVGGSSRIPLVARLIQQSLGVTPTSLDQPETSVVTGALYLPLAGSGGPPAAAYPPPRPPVGGPGPPAPPAPPAPPGRGRRRLLGIGTGVLAAVLLAGLGIGLAVRGGSSGPAASGSDPTSPATLEQYFDDDAVHDYVRPTFREIRRCQRGFGSGRTSTAVPSSTTCTYANDIVASFAKASSASTINLYRDTLASLLPAVVGAPASKGSWSHGHLDSYRGSRVVGLYWDDSQTGIFGFALVDAGKLRLADLQSWWRGRFG
jgi:hypothetical protein